jgi:F-type H+-transporting ATPase subunit b
MLKAYLKPALILGLAAVLLTPARGWAAPEEGGGNLELMHLNLVEAVWVVVIFLILLALLYKTAWKNVLAGLKAREDRIRGDIAGAEDARIKAESALKDYNTQIATAEAKVREMLSQAATQGEQIAAQIRTRAQQESEETKERALRDIEQAKRQAVNDLYDQAASLATNVAEKILRRNLNPDDARDLVNRSLEQLSTVSQ